MCYPRWSQIPDLRCADRPGDCRFPLGQPSGGPEHCFLAMAPLKWRRQPVKVPAHEKRAKERTGRQSTKHGYVAWQGFSRSIDDVLMSAPASPDPGPEESLPPAPQGIGAGLDFSDPNSPLAPYYLQTSHIVAVGMGAMVFVFLCFVPLWHTDIWAHLKFGQWILQHGRLPDADPFCFFSDADSTPHHGWLSQAIFYALFHAGELLAGGDRLQRLAGGVELLRLSHALIVTLRCLVLLAAFRRSSGSLPLACLALAVMLLLSVGNIAILRPQVLGELCFAMV